MKILIGSDGNNIDSPISKRFGHANYYLVYDTETKVTEVYENNLEEHDHDNLQIYINNGVNTFIVGNIGPHAYEKINTPTTKIYLARSMSGKEAIEKLNNNELKLLAQPTAKKSIGHDHDHSHSQNNHTHDHDHKHDHHGKGLGKGKGNH